VTNPKAASAFDARYIESLRRGDAHVERHFKAHFRDLIRLKLCARLKCTVKIESLERTIFGRVLAVLRAAGRHPPPQRLGALVHEVCKHVLVQDTGPVVRQVLSDLPERDRHLLRSVLVEGRDKAAACADLGLPRGYLLELVHRARKSGPSMVSKCLLDDLDDAP
jgi:hypothetical protein